MQKPDHKPALQPLLTDANFRDLLGGIGERKFHELRAAGVVPPPLELGPRQLRWTHADYLATLARLPRKERTTEPATLAAGRAARIERTKAAGAKS